MPGLEPSDAVYLMDRRHLVRQQQLSCGVVAAALLTVCLAALAAKFPARTVILVSVLAAGAPAVACCHLMRQAGRTRLQLLRSELREESDQHVRTVPWRAVTSVRVQVRTTGEPSAIELQAMGSRPLELTGYEAMADLVADIQARVPASAAIVLTPHRLVLDRPLRLAVWLAAGAIAPVLAGIILR
jgi:hypothetical protein